MANNYLLFSTMIDTLTEDESAWLHQALDGLEDHIEGVETKPPTLPEVLRLWQFFSDEGMVDFNWEFEDDGLWIYAEESGTPEHVAELVQAFLAKFRPDDYFGFEWAITCSKPRVDEFGGGAVYITATEVRWMHTGRWLSEQQ